MWDYGTCYYNIIIWLGIEFQHVYMNVYKMLSFTVSLLFCVDILSNKKRDVEIISRFYFRLFY